MTIDIEFLCDIQAKMRFNGHRRLMVISGAFAWCDEQISLIKSHFEGDFVTLSHKNGLAPEQAKSLLGSEYLHAILDVREGFSLDAFAMVAGALKAGSFLILIAPDFLSWPSMPDRDSLRWYNGDKAIATPQFVAHFLHIIQEHDSVVYWRQDQPPECKNRGVAAEKCWQPQTEVTTEQSQILTTLLQGRKGHFVLTAKRGRGKSALAGMLTQARQCWVTAPNKRSTSTLFAFANQETPFIAPDRLIELCHNAPETIAEKWLIIDEAAMLPLPMLDALLNTFPAVLLTTTIDGYEGTGQGFALKLRELHPECTWLTLQTPIRWATQDPLEAIMEAICLFDPARNTASTSKMWKALVQFRHIDQTQFSSQPALLRGYYQLLKSAHYRTTTQDFRRLLDAPGMQLSVAQTESESVIGAMWAIDEGGLSTSLSADIWAGRRRPKGNLVAQALTAFAGEVDAACLRSIRISRIAVTPDWRRKGLASQLILQQRQNAEKLRRDFLSVSFGYTTALFHFWQQCGFETVHVGTHPEASSGSVAVMMMIPLSEAGGELFRRLTRKLQRNYPYLQSDLPFDLPLLPAKDSPFDADDYQEVSGFAYAHRTLEASKGALIRLLNLQPQPDLLLHRHLINKETETLLIQSMQFAGRRELLAQWRIDAQQCLSRYL